MTMHRIKNIVLASFFVLLYGTAVIAAPNESEVDDNAGEYTIVTAAPSLDLPQQILKDSNKVIDKSLYDEASAIIRANINVVSSQIKNYTDYKDSVNDKIGRFTAQEDSINISEENKIKVRQLIKSIPQEVKKEKVLAADESVSTLVKNEEYFKALEKLNSTLISKQSQLADIEKTISIWQQIDVLID